MGFVMLITVHVCLCTTYIERWYTVQLLFWVEVFLRIEFRDRYFDSEKQYPAYM